jgi:hypothetical protein
MDCKAFSVSPAEYLYRYTKGLTGQEARGLRPLFSTSLQAKTPSGPSTHKNAALVMPKFGLTVEKRPGAAIEGGSTRIHLLANSELTQVKQNITSTARELRRGAKRKPGIRVSQGVALAAAKTFRVGGEGEGEPLPRQRGRILHKPTQSPIDPSQQTKSGENHA